MDAVAKCSILKDLFALSQDFGMVGRLIEFCFGGVVIPLIFPKVPRSSQPESSRFPSYPLPLHTPPLRTL